MKISQTTEKTFGINIIFPSLSILLLMIIMVLPYKIQLISDIMPFLTLIGIYYWSVFKPGMMPVAVVFILGVMQDILLGSPIGLMPFLFIIVQQFVFFQGRQFLERDFIFNWVVFVMLVMGYGFLYWAITSLYYKTMLSYIDISGQVFLTIAFYPIITGLLGLIRKAIK